MLPELRAEQFFERQLFSRLARFTDSDDATIACRAGVIKTRFALLLATDALSTALITRRTLLFSARGAQLVLTKISKRLQETQKPVAIALVQLMVECF